MNRRNVEDLRYQLSALQEELRAYEGIGENLGNLRRRLEQLQDENRRLKIERETRLLDEAMIDLFLHRASKIENLELSNAEIRAQLQDRGDDDYQQLKNANDFLRARVLEQNLHIEHLKERLRQLSDAQMPHTYEAEFNNEGGTSKQG